MSDLTAKHYLDIYESRLSMAKERVTNPADDVVSGMKRLVSSLRKLPPETGIRVAATDESYVYTVAKTGEVIAEIELG